MYVVWILPTWVDYEESYMCLKWIVGIKYISKWVYGNILSNSMKKYIEKYVSLIMGYFFLYFGQHKVI